MAVIVPSLKPQVAGEEVAVSVGAAKSTTFTICVIEHKLASLAIIV